MDNTLENIELNASSIEGWSKQEKFYLLQALKAFRSNDIERIHEYVSTKSHQEIIMAINHYKKIASKHPVFEKSVNLPKKSCKPRVPLTRWAKLLTDTFTLDDLKTETSTAVRMIAELGKLPEPISTENIDFRKIYHTIANAMEGKTLISDKLTVAVFHKCIIETALSSKAFIKTTSYKNIISSIDLEDKEAHSFPKPTENQELSIIRHLATQTRYNPLKIQEAYLTPTSDALFLDKK